MKRGREGEEIAAGGLHVPCLIRRWKLCTLRHVHLSGQAGTLDRPEESEAGLKLEDQSDLEDSALLPSQDQGPQLKVQRNFSPSENLQMVMTLISRVSGKDDPTQN